MVDLEKKTSKGIRWAYHAEQFIWLAGQVIALVLVFCILSYVIHLYR